MAQTAIQPGTIVGTFHAAGPSGSTGGLVFTVPDGRNARVTDIKVHNFDAAQLCHASVVFGSTATYFSINAASQTIAVNVISGYGLLPGSTVMAYNNGCVNGYYVEIRGFYFTIP